MSKSALELKPRPMGIEIIRKVFSLICVVLVLLTLPLAAIQKPSSADETIKLSTEIVLLEAEVLSKKTGQAIGGLKKQDFVLYEDGVRQEIVHFGMDKLPLSVLILLDVSGSVWPSIKKLRDGALEALQNLRAEDEVAVMVFAGHAKLILNFTRDKQAAATAIQEANRQGVGSETDPNEAVFQAAAYLRNATSRESRRIIVAISDDVSTHKATSLSKSKTNHELLESGSVVCGLFFDSIYKTKAEPTTDPYTSINQTILILGETDIIKSYVDGTGGVTIGADQQNIKEGFIHLLERLRTRYSFGYISSNQDRNGKFRRIKLVLLPDIDKREKGVAIITRKGYYTQSSR